MTHRTAILIQNILLIALTAWVYTLSGSAWCFLLLFFFWSKEESD